MKKRLLRLTSVIFLLTTLFFSVGFTFKSELINILVNGKELKTKVQPMIVNDTVMVPIRDISESLGALVTWDEETNSVSVKTKDKIYEKVAALPDDGVTLTAVDNTGTYKDFYLEVNGCKRYFDWKNVLNPTHAPKLILDDINQDGQNELIVILTTGYGTGVYISEAHVIDPKSLTETYIDNPNIVILKNVKTNITDNIEISIGDQKTVINKNKYNISPSNLASAVGFGSICDFEVVDNKLVVTMPAQISPTCFIGELRITYAYKDNMYQTDKIEFSEDCIYAK